MKRILVAFVTKTGTTEETAGEIADVLRAAGMAVDVAPMAGAPSFADYDGMVLGAPINGMRLVPEAPAFSAARQGELEGKLAAVFAVSYMHGHCRPIWDKAIRKSVDSWAKSTGTRASAIFGGRITVAMPVAARLIFGLPKDYPLDSRDHDAVKSWAKQIIPLLAPGAARA